MSRRFHIIGAGMAGMIAAHAFRSYSPVILEAQQGLPHNHEALLRFRSELVSDVCGVAFRPVTVRKSIYSGGQYVDRADPQLANMYSRKVVRQVVDRSIWNMEPCTRYIAPPYLPEGLAARLDIAYGTPIQSVASLLDYTRTGPVVSTIPMPIMMKLIGWSDMPEFTAYPIWSVNVDFTTPQIDVHQTIYFPDSGVDYYRASLTGRRLIVEFVREPGSNFADHIADIVKIFGLDPALYVPGLPKLHRLGKIAPIDDDLRREFIYTLTREYGVYSLGRFATWRPLLLDDIVGDCDVIERLIGGESRRSRYQQSLASVRNA